MLLHSIIVSEQKLERWVTRTARFTFYFHRVNWTWIGNGRMRGTVQSPRFAFVTMERTLPLPVRIHAPGTQEQFSSDRSAAPHRRSFRSKTTRSTLRISLLGVTACIWRPWTRLPAAIPSIGTLSDFMTRRQSMTRSAVSPKFRQPVSEIPSEFQPSSSTATSLFTRDWSKESTFRNAGVNRGCFNRSETNTAPSRRRNP